MTYPLGRLMNKISLLQLNSSRNLVAEFKALRCYKEKHIIRKEREYIVYVKVWNWSHQKNTCIRKEQEYIVYWMFIHQQHNLVARKWTHAGVWRVYQILIRYHARHVVEKPKIEWTIRKLQEQKPVPSISTDASQNKIYVINSTINYP